MVLLLLEGSNNLMALGATKVEVSIKKINNKKTRSDMEAILKFVSLLFRILIAISLIISISCLISYPNNFLLLRRFMKNIHKF